MSSLSSLFNSCATLFTIDIYKKLYPKTAEVDLVKVGRIATAIVVGLGIAWIPILRSMSEDSGLYKYLQDVQGYLAPSITAVFLLGLFYRGTTSTAAMFGLVSGFLIGITKLTIQLFYSTEDNFEGQKSVLQSIADFNFLYASGVLFAITVVSVIGVSAVTKSPDEKQIEGLTWHSIDKKMLRESWSAFDVIATVIVMALVVGIYTYFSFWI